MIERLIKVCKENNAIPIVILKIPNFKKEEEPEDSGIKEYALIYRYEKGYNALNSELSLALYRMNEEHEKPAQDFDVDHVSDIKAFIEELNVRDGYVVIWKDEKYKDSDKIKSEIKRQGLDIDVIISKTYTIKVSYDEMKKYCGHKSMGMMYQYDLFRQVLTDNHEFNVIVHNDSFDVAKMTDFCYTDEGIVFVFVCKLESRKVFNDEEEQESKVEEYVRKFENSNTSNILIHTNEAFNGLLEAVWNKFNEIVGRKSNAKDKSYTRSDWSKFFLGRKRI